MVKIYRLIQIKSYQLDSQNVQIQNVFKRYHSGRHFLEFYLQDGGKIRWLRCGTKLRCWWQLCRAFNCRILYDHYLPTVILIVTLIIIGIPSPTHSLTLGLNPCFSANPPYPAFPFSPSGFTIWISHTVYCYFWAYPSFYFLVYLFLHIFSCRFRAVD